MSRYMHLQAIVSRRDLGPEFWPGWRWLTAEFERQRRYSKTPGALAYLGFVIYSLRYPPRRLGDHAQHAVVPSDWQKQIQLKLCPDRLTF